MSAGPISRPQENFGAARYGPLGVYALPEDPVAVRRARSHSRVMWMLYTVVSWWACTEFLAWRLGEDPALGPYLIPGVYLPWQWLQWSTSLLFAQYRSPAVARSIHLSIYVTIGLAAVGFIGSILLAMRNYKRSLRNSPRAPDLRGSAHWASPAEIRRMGLLSKKPNAAR
jgi:type IV secretory pathway TraG/TraD family ATPase VirD4